MDTLLDALMKRLSFPIIAASLAFILSGYSWAASQRPLHPAPALVAVDPNADWVGRRLTQAELAQLRSQVRQQWQAQSRALETATHEPMDDPATSTKEALATSSSSVQLPEIGSPLDAQAQP